MSPDPESTSANRPRPAISDGPGGARPAKPLGRGLEDISHLFLSQGAALPRASDRPENSEMTRAAAVPPQPPVVLSPSGALTLGQLAVALTESHDALGERLKVIDAGITCGACGEIDLLAADSVNRLAIIDIETNRGDAILVRALSHIAWMARSTALTRRMYQGRMIDFARQPRLFLVAPRFSAPLISAVSQVTHTEIRCFRYYGVNISGGVGIVFEQVNSDDG
jgi:hypothetical protein